MKRAIFILFALCISFSPILLHAQLSGISKADVDINVVPSNPTPNQDVTVSLSSFVTDINAAKITWTINGKVAKSGTGEKNFTFNAGGVGVTTTIGLSVITAQGKSIQNSFKIKPSNVDLVWQSESYTPPFYKGKALFSLQNKITFVAIPHLTSGSGAEISAKNLIYRWSKGGSVDEKSSGFGRNAFTVTPGIIARPLDITVEVSSQDGTISGLATLHVDPKDPTILFYKKSPLYGIEFQKALSGTVDMGDEKEISIIVEPFFFGTLNPTQSLSYKWRMNGIQIDSDTSQMARVFRPTEGVVGTSRISISIENLEKILQLASSDFTLKFGAKNE